MPKFDLSDLFSLLGLALVTGGVALVSVPLALVVAGALCLYVGLPRPLASRQKAE